MPEKSADAVHDARTARSVAGVDGATDELDRSGVELHHLKAELHDEDPFFEVNLDLDEVGALVLACRPRNSLV
jgi:hypothetical protein